MYEHCTSTYLHTCSVYIGMYYLLYGSLYCIKVPGQQALILHNYIWLLICGTCKTHNFSTQKNFFDTCNNHDLHFCLKPSNSFLQNYFIIENECLPFECFGKLPAIVKCLCSTLLFVDLLICQNSNDKYIGKVGTLFYSYIFCQFLFSFIFTQPGIFII